jgi:hypothetical protein
VVRNNPIYIVWSYAFVDVEMLKHCQYVRRLMALAHLDLPQAARETIACDYFINSLNDADFSLKVRQRNPGTVDEALRISLQLEAWQQATDRLRLE